MSGSLQLSHTNSSQTGKEEEGSHSSLGSDPVEVWKFSLDDIKGPVCTTQKVTTLHSQCVGQYQCQRTLYVGSCTHGTDTRSPVACSSGTNCDLWRIASWVLKGNYLPAQLECLHHGNSHKSRGWIGSPCQPSATGSPPNQDYWKVT